MLKSISLLIAVSVAMPLDIQPQLRPTGLQTEVVLLNGGQKTQLTGAQPQERSRNVRILLLGFSMDLITIGGLKSAVNGIFYDFGVD